MNFHSFLNVFWMAYIYIYPDFVWRVRATTPKRAHLSGLGIAGQNCNLKLFPHLFQALAPTALAAEAAALPDEAQVVQDRAVLEDLSQTYQQQAKLVGGFKHFLFSIIYGIILPIDELHHFPRGTCRYTTNQQGFSMLFSNDIWWWSFRRISLTPILKLRLELGHSECLTRQQDASKV